MSVVLTSHAPGYPTTPAFRVNGRVYRPDRSNRIVVAELADVGGLLALGCTLCPMNAYGQEVDPTADDDFTQEYYYGSQWQNGDALFSCVDPTPGAAVWATEGGDSWTGTFQGFPQYPGTVDAQTTLLPIDVGGTVYSISMAGLVYSFLDPWGLGNVNLGNNPIPEDSLGITVTSNNSSNPANLSTLIGGRANGMNAVGLTVLSLGNWPFETNMYRASLRAALYGYSSSTDAIRLSAKGEGATDNPANLLPLGVTTSAFEVSAVLLARGPDPQADYAVMRASCLLLCDGTAADMVLAGSGAFTVDSALTSESAAGIAAVLAPETSDGTVRADVTPPNSDSWAYSVFLDIKQMG